MPERGKLEMSCMTDSHLVADRRRMERNNCVKANTGQTQNKLASVLLLRNTATQ